MFVYLYPGLRSIYMVDATREIRILQFYMNHIDPEA